MNYPNGPLGDKKVKRRGCLPGIYQEMAHPNGSLWDKLLERVRQSVLLQLKKYLPPSTATNRQNQLRIIRVSIIYF